MALLAAQPPPRPAPPPGGEAWLLVETLPVRQRAAVVLRHAGGLTETQIGDALGVTRSTISSSLADAYRRLAVELAAADSDTDADAAGPMTAAPMELALAVVRSCGPDGCDLEPLAKAPTSRAGYSEAVRDRIRIRRGDLVAVGPSASGPTIVWRWWSGTVEAMETDRTITVSREVTRGPDGAPRAAFPVALPPDLVGGVDVGETVWFGTEEDHKVVVAVAGPEAERRAAARFPAIRQAIA
ncbi:MAG TPA: sigma factor-like helix-turn-helix DNA-binding protein [Acidimicrobiales bacterium]|nr:sigma factor-like helix-turn-helix DNA-binding protein [Acidimicrobiales bacterium]